MVESKAGVYTLKNYGKAVNCSLIAVFPAKIRILNLDVGVLRPEKKTQIETGTIYQVCLWIPSKKLKQLNVFLIFYVHTYLIKGQSKWPFYCIIRHYPFVAGCFYVLISSLFIKNRANLNSILKLLSKGNVRAKP